MGLGHGPCSIIRLDLLCRPCVILKSRCYTSRTMEHFKEVKRATAANTGFVEHSITNITGFILLDTTDMDHGRSSEENL